MPTCRNPSLGLTTKAKACKVVGQEGSPGVKESVREWTLTAPRELSLWELESRWTPESSKSDYRGQNPMDWRVIYTIEKLLKRRCLKWACITHWTSKTLVRAKRKACSQIGNLILNHYKLGIAPISLCVGGMRLLLESSQRGSQIFFKPHLNRRSACKVMVPQSCGSPNMIISGLPLGQAHNITRGKVVASLKSKLWWVLWVRVCSWLVLALKVLQWCTNQLVVWFCVGSCEW
jgi:hypothetical protein